MKVTIIRPPVMMPAFNMASLVVPPIGPAYIAAAVRKAGHDVSFIDAVGLGIEKYTPYREGTALHGLSFSEIVDQIPSGAEVIGFSLSFSFEWPLYRDLIKAVRVRFPQALLVAGGEHATATPEFSLEESPLDVIVMGEGENIFCDMLELYAKEGIQSLEKAHGLVLKTSGGKIVKTVGAPRISDLQSIPRPAWDLVPLEAYLSRGYGFGVDRGRSIPVLGTRGCPYQCTFCSNPSMWTVRWKARDPNDLLDEIAELQKTYNATNFDFYDLTAIVRREWILDFCNAIDARGMKFTWQLPSGTRSEAIDSEITQALYRTGCRNVSYSPESGSKETLEIIKKRVSIPHLMLSMRTAVRNKINVKCNFIFGFPKDRWKNIIESLWAIAQAAWIGIHDIAIWVFVPYPGSELFRDLRAEGKIPVMDDAYFFRLAAYADITKTYSYCRSLTKRQLLWSRLFGTFLFYGLSWLRRPWRPFVTIYNAITGHLESRSELALRGFIRRTFQKAA